MGSKKNKAGIAIYTFIECVWSHTVYIRAANGMNFISFIDPTIFA